MRAATQFTRGIVTDCNATTRVSYRRGTAVFRDQIIVQAIGSQFSAGGDSGSLVVSEAQHRPVGLLFAGSATHTIINKIGRVLAAFRARIVV